MNEHVQRYAKLDPDWATGLATLIPPHMHQGIINWVIDGILPGHFLTAILTNDLSRAIHRADHINLARLPQYVSFFRNCAPALCFGSPAIVDAWKGTQSK